MKDIISRFTSRKFLLALLGIVTVFFGDKIHLSADQITAITALVISFTAAEGVADVVTRYTNAPAIEDTSTSESQS